MDSPATIPEEVSTIIHTSLAPREIGCLSLAVRSASSHDEVWNNKIHKLGYPSVPCPQGFYFLITSIRDENVLLASLINTGVAAYVKAYLSRMTKIVSYDSIVKSIITIAPEVAEVLRPSVKAWVDRYFNMNAVVSNTDFFDLVLSVIPSDERQKCVNKGMPYGDYSELLPVYAKYRLRMYSLSGNNNALALLHLPWMSNERTYKTLPARYYEPLLADFEAAYARDPDTYQPVMDIIANAPLDGCDGTSWPQSSSSSEEVVRRRCGSFSTSSSSTGEEVVTASRCSKNSSSASCD